MPVPTTPVVDNYDRANETPLVTGGLYAGQISGLAANLLDLISNEVGNTVNRLGSVRTTEIFDDNCECYVQIPVRSVAASGQSVAIRVSDPGAAWNAYWLTVRLVSGNTYAFTLFRTTGGATHTVIGAAVNRTFLDGDWIRIKITTTTITTSHRTATTDWQQVHSVVDTTLTSGAVGYFIDGTTGRADNFGFGVPSGIVDHFTRANETPLNGGGKWAQINALQARPNLANNRVEFAGSRSAYRPNLIPDADCEVSLTIVQKPSNDNHGIHLLARGVNFGTGTWGGYEAVARNHTGTDQIFLWRIQNGGADLVMVNPIFQEIAGGHKLKITCKGNIISLWYDSGSGYALLGSAVDSAFPNAGHVGFRGESGSIIDDFRVGPLDYPTVVASDGPYAYWRLGDLVGSSNASDASGQGRSGAYNGTVDLEEVGAIPDDFSVHIPSSSASFVRSNFIFNSSPATVEVLFYYDGVNTTGLICGCMNGDGDGTFDKLLGIEAGVPYWYIYDGLEKRVNGSALSVGWHHIVGTVGGGNMRLYVDSTQVGSQAASGSFSTYNVNNVFVGARVVIAAPPLINAVAQRLAGRRDEFAIYNKVLSPAQITAHYEAFFSTPLYEDIGTVLFKLIPSGSDIHTGGAASTVDAGTVPLLLKPTGVDIGPYTDTAVVPLLLEPSSEDYGPISDEDTAILRLQPFALPAPYEDEGAVILNLVPTADEFAFHDCKPRLRGTLVGWHTDDYALQKNWAGGVTNVWRSELLPVEAVVNHPC